MSLLDNFIFNYYPYIALSIGISVAIYRFQYRPQSISTHSTHMLASKSSVIGNNLFHIGLIMVLIGHFAGMFTPEFLYEGLITPRAHLIIAMVGGSIFGVMALIGGLILFVRRFNPRFKQLPTQTKDVISLLYIIMMLCTGLYTINDGVADVSGESLELVASWAQGIVTFQVNPAQYAAQLSVALKVHMFLGLTLILISPFTKLVHAYSGINAIVSYLFFRPYYIIYRDGKKRR